MAYGFEIGCSHTSSSFLHNKMLSFAFQNTTVTYRRILLLSRISHINQSRYRCSSDSHGAMHHGNVRYFGPIAVTIFLSILQLASGRRRVVSPMFRLGIDGWDGFVFIRCGVPGDPGIRYASGKDRNGRHGVSLGGPSIGSINVFRRFWGVHLLRGYFGQ